MLAHYSRLDVPRRPPCRMRPSSASKVASKKVASGKVESGSTGTLRGRPWCAFLLLPLLGENWHNNHHSTPHSASTWVWWYQLDVQYLVVRLFELVGLASILPL